MFMRDTIPSTLRFLTLCAFGIFLIAAPLAAQSQPPQPAPSSTPRADSASAFREELITEVPSGTELKGWSSAGNHAGWVEKKGGDWIVKLDGKQQGGTYQNVEYFALSRDGNHVHFFGKREGKWLHVFDGKEASPAYVDVTTVSLQPSGNSFAFCACIEKKNCHLIVDDKQAPDEYNDVSFPRYSPDGKHLAFFAKPKKKWVAIVDGKQSGPELEEVAFQHSGFSPASNHFYAAVAVRAKWTYLVDDSFGPAFDTISPMAFSSDDKHYAYAGVDSHGGFKKQKTTGAIILDGRPGTQYEGAGMTGLWTLALGANQTIAVGPRNLQPNFHGVSNPTFGPDGTLAFAARRDKGDVVAMYGEQAGPSFDDVVSAILVSDATKHSNYVGRRGDTFVAVRDDQPGKSFPIGAKIGWVDWIKTSEKGDRLAFELVRGGNQFKAGGTPRARRTVVLDDQPGKEYNADAISVLLFSTDHRHYIYPVVGIDDKRDLVVADGAESKQYDNVLDLHFTPEGAATFLARDSGRLLRVTYVFP